MKEQSLKHIEYKVFNSVQRVESNSIEQRYNSLQGKVAEAVADDSIITVLLTYIILFSPDFCKLTEKRPVEQLQVRAKVFHFVQVLHKKASFTVMLPHCSVLHCGAGPVYQDAGKIRLQPIGPDRGLPDSRQRSQLGHLHPGNGGYQKGSSNKPDSEDKLKGKQQFIRQYILYVLLETNQLQT